MRYSITRKDRLVYCCLMRYGVVWFGICVVREFQPGNRLKRLTAHICHESSKDATGNETGDNKNCSQAEHHISSTY